jgi:hypothetical protein
LIEAVRAYLRTNGLDCVEYEYRFAEYEYRFAEYEYRFAEYEYDEIRCRARTSYLVT